jgi:hypothetical protein
MAGFMLSWGGDMALLIGFWTSLKGKQKWSVTVFEPMSVGSNASDSVILLTLAPEVTHLVIIVYSKLIYIFGSIFIKNFAHGGDSLFSFIKCDL